MLDVEAAKKTKTYIGKKRQLGDKNWRIDNLYSIVNESGSVIPFKRNEAQLAYSPNRHSRDVIAKARKLGFCLDPAQLILTADMKWQRIDSLTIGQKLVSVDEMTPGGKGHHRKMRSATVEAIREVHDYGYKITMDNGVTVIATPSHRFLCRRRVNVETQWRAVGKMLVGDLIRYITQPGPPMNLEDAWFGGLLDGEGSLRRKPEGGFEMCVSQNAGIVLDRARRYLSDNNYTFKEVIDSRPMSGKAIRNIPCHKLMIYRTNEAFRLISQTQPTRFVTKPWWDGFGLPGSRSGMAWARVIAIEPVENQRMIDLQTSTKTFICEGLISHNSTFIDIKILDTCMFRTNITAGIIDAKLDDAVKKLAMINFAYKHMDGDLQAANPLVKENTEQLVWENGSSVSVGTSYRGGTPVILHCSEFGRTSVDQPDAARLIKTGSFQAVPATGWCVVESTGHGTAGEFYDMVKHAEAKQHTGQQLSVLDWKLHFYGWWLKQEYRLPNNLIVVSQELRDYFGELNSKLKTRYGITIDADQQAWYAQKVGDLGTDDMLEEFPSLSEELFFSSIRGAFWKKEISRARQDKRIGLPVPYDPSRRVETWWDIGEDCTAIIFVQTDGLRYRLIDYHEEEGGSIQSAATVLEDKRRERGFVYSQHIGPHDLEHREWGNNATTRVKTALDLGIKFDVVPQVLDKGDSIDLGRRLLNNVWIDEVHCKLLVERFENYRKRWNKALQVYSSDPVHDAASHPSDSFQQGAMYHDQNPRSGMKAESRRPRAERPRGSQWAN